MPPNQKPPRKFPSLDHVEEVMRRFVRDYPEAVVLGGWSTFLRTGIAKSHDIDVIVDHSTLDKLKAEHELSASRHFSGRKFELKVDGIAVDVYPVFQSKLGQKLQVPVEILIDHTDRLSGIRVLGPDAQFVAKMAALLDRPDSLAGEKDRREMVALLKVDNGPDLHKCVDLLRRAGWSTELQYGLWRQTFDFLLETDGLTGQDKTMLKLRRAQTPVAMHSRDREGQEVER